MQNTKLIETLRTLSSRELRRWRDYVHADFFNKNRLIRHLCADVLLYTPAFEDQALDKRQVYARLFGADDAYNELKINNLISDLFQLLLNFLAYVEQEADHLETFRRTTDALLSRNLDKQAGKVLEQYRALLDRRSDRTAHWYRHELHWWEASEQLYHRQTRRSIGEHLNRRSEAIAVLHRLEQLDLQVGAMSRQSLAVVETAAMGIDLAPFDEHTPDFIRNHPCIAVYRQACALMERPGPDTFNALVDGLQRHHRMFLKDELTSFYQCALNYCIRRINDGQSEAYSEALHLYRSLIDQDLLLTGGRLSQWTYKNIATTGMRSGAFDWTEDFLHTYQHFLPAAERENAYAFNLASLYFEKAEYGATLRTLLDVGFTDFTYHFGAKILQLKCFFLLHETSAFSSLLDSTRQLLRRNKSLSAYGKTTNLNFLKLLSDLNKWSVRKENWPRSIAAQKKLDLLEKIRQTQPVANKDWLLKSLEAA
jgi:hypothetical protein